MRPLFCKLVLRLAERDLFSLALFCKVKEEQMADGERSRERSGEAFWRSHHEAWRQRDLKSARVL